MNVTLDVYEAQKEFKRYVTYIQENVGNDRADDSLESFAIWFQGEWPRFLNAVGTPCFIANRDPCKECKVKGCDEELKAVCVEKRHFKELPP